MPLNDFRYGARLLRKSPGLSALIILILALGIGASTAIFSVVDAVLIRPLPFRDPGRLVLVREDIPHFGTGIMPVCASDVPVFERQNRVFDEMGVFRVEGMDLTGAGEPERIAAGRSSASLFRILGVRPLIGRTFTRDEDAPGHPLAVLSYGLWTRRFGGDRGVLGRRITLDRRPYTVIGVMPRGFEFPLRGMPMTGVADLWVPIAFTAEELNTQGDNFDFGVVARLRPGVTLEQANSDVRAIAAGIRQTYPPEYRTDLDLTAKAEPLRQDVVGGSRRLLLVLLGAVGLLMAIACANVANLLLARAATRRGEIAIRSALGAGRARLFRQLLAESLLVAAGGAAAGCLLAVWGSDAFVTLAGKSIPLLNEVAVDRRVLAFALVLAIATAVLFGLAPFAEFSRGAAGEALKQAGGRAGGGRHAGRLRAALVTAEVALSLMLLIGAGLLLRSFERAIASDPGFRPAQVLTASVTLPGVAYTSTAQARSFYERLLERLGRLPGVESVGAGTDLPLRTGNLRIYSVEGQGTSAPRPIVSHTAVMGDYFRALGIPLKRGRWFDERDRADGPLVMIVSEAAARAFWPGQNPIGKRLKSGPPVSNDPWITVVGMVGDVKDSALDKAPRNHTYNPAVQNGGMNSLRVAIRAAGRPEDMATALRREVWALDPNVPVVELETMQRIAAESVAPRRFHTLLVAAFAGAALLLAAAGLYGVVSYSVAQRAREVGIRMALGAGHGDVLRLVVGQGMGLCLVGVAVGLAAAAAAGRVLASLLYGIGANDPMTFAAVAAIMIAVALAASYVPARRAARAEPNAALRHE